MIWKRRKFVLSVIPRITEEKKSALAGIISYSLSLLFVTVPTVFFSATSPPASRLINSLGFIQANRFFTLHGKLHRLKLNSSQM